jgi:hypothetical protein
LLKLSRNEKAKDLAIRAELGPGPHRSGDIAEKLDRKVTSLGPTRNQLIAKGMIWSPNHGDTAFTVPLFDQFMKRIMPGDEWLAGHSPFLRSTRGRSDRTFSRPWLGDESFSARVSE